MCGGTPRWSPSSWKPTLGPRGAGPWSQGVHQTGVFTSTNPHRSPGRRPAADVPGDGQRTSASLLVKLPTAQQTCAPRRGSSRKTDSDFAAKPAGSYAPARQPRWHRTPQVGTRRPGLQGAGPESVREIRRRWPASAATGKTGLAVTVRLLKDRLTAAGVRHCEVKAAPKHLYGNLEQDCRHQQRPSTEILRLAALRILTEDVEQGVLPGPGRGARQPSAADPRPLKDYIGLPKPNGYQSRTSPP